MPEKPAERSSPRKSLAEQFAELWNKGNNPPDVFEFLRRYPEAGPKEQAQVLRVDQSHRWKSGTGWPVEQYLKRCPNVATDDESKLALIAGEFEERTALGEPLELESYLQRFPELTAPLRATLSAKSDETVRQPRPTIAETVQFPVPEISETIDVPPPGTNSANCTEAQSAGETVQVDVSFDDPSETVVKTGPTNLVGSDRLQAVRPTEAGDHEPEDVIGRFGDYELLREIARGGMGIVYKARQVRLNRIVALKMILTGQFADDEEIARFHTEAEAAAQLDHPHIVPIYEVGEHEGRHYFSMGFVEGKSLADKIAEGPVSPREAAGLMKSVAEAVAYAHERKIIHRDLKPANVLLDPNGQPRVTDFGLAKSTETASQLTATGQIMGTPSYMPPEQALGKMEQVGPLADVYSLGAVLYCLLTGRPPFQAASVVDTLRQVVEKEPVSPQQLNPEVDRDLETICLKCLAKEPRNRYASAGELAEELGRFLSGEPIRARPVGTTERLWRWCKRKPVVASLIALSVVSLVVGTAVSTSFAIIAHRRALEAERERENATRAVNDFFTTVSEETLLNQPGLQPLRRDLLQRALDYYQEFLKTRGDDPTIRDELAETFYRVGVITEELSAPAEALPYFDQGLDLARKVLAENPNSLPSLETLGDLLNAKGKMLVRMQRLDEAFGVYQEALDVRERLAEADSENSEFQRVYANSYMNLGLVEKERDNADEAKRLMEKAQQIRRRQLEHTGDPRLRRDLAMGAYNLGNLLLFSQPLNQHQLRSAEGYYEHAVRLFEELYRENPRDLNNRHRLALCCRRVGDLKADANDWETAEEMYAQSRQHFEALARENPDVPEYQAAVAAVYTQLGYLKRRQQRSAEAIESFERAYRITQNLHEEYSNVAQYRGDLAVVLRELGEVQLGIGQTEIGRKNLNASRRHLEALVQQFPDNEEYRYELQETESALQKDSGPVSTKDSSR